MSICKGNIMFSNSEAPLSLLLHRASCRVTKYHTTNKCTNCMSFILNHFLKHFHCSYMCSLMMISDMLSKHVLAVKSVLKKWFKINYIQLVHLLVVWYLIILVVIPDIKICTSRQCTEQKALANSEVHKWLLNYGSTERNLFHVTVLASRIWMWLFNFWKICGSTGILRLGVLQIAEVTARSVQAMHIWVSFMCIKYTHTRTHPM